MAEKRFEEKLEGWGDKIANTIDYDRLKLWKEIFFHPTDVLTAEQKNVSLGRAAKDVFIACLPVMLLSFLFALLTFAYIGFTIFAIVITTFQEYAAAIGIGGIVALILGVILYFLMPIIGWLVSSAIQFVVAKIFGGKANFTTHAYLTGISTASARAAAIPFLLFSLIPCVGYIAGPIVTIIGFYTYYLKYKSIKISHNLDDVGAIIATVSDFILFMGLVILGIVAFYAGMFSLIYAGSGS